MPRVVSGEFRGAQLLAPKGDNTRPTTDKVKEALFSIIQTRVAGSDVLDLFSGTGGIGIEAVSRGADSAVMVDKDGRAVSVIRKNLEKIHAEKDPRFTVLKTSFLNAVDALYDEGRKFDIIFLDPPYKIAHKSMCELADKLMEKDILKEGGIVIAEHSSDLPFDTDVINLQSTRSCSYGLTMLTFFSRG
ncbi:MAG: 16S rRNA (guanine(966)-N(2))-methyltransferase RsmD [Clostridiales bacterium]|nr:16S rRNA (guanine(966)-N(2))-methyltransferase RsmD [Clostridiales bacterium]